MWESLNLKFSKYPARMAVAQKMFELGLRISEDGKIYCGDLKISDSALAAAANVDRRVIKSTVDVIIADEGLYEIFSNIIPAGTLIKNIAKSLNLGNPVLTIITEDPIPGELLNEFIKVEGVLKVSIL